MSEGDETLIAGRYRLEHQIGSGAMGVVWRAIDVRLDRSVAVKQLLLPPGLNETETEKARQRAFREGRIAARLQHPNAISVYNVADHEGQPVLVMEYLPSRSLADILDQRGVLPPAEIAGVGAQVAAALVKAHDAGVIHRDVKPGNILIADDGIAKITDFGISRAAGDITVTSTGLLAGTPAFLSPETARGAEPGPAADVFSLGATLYAAVEGRPPFENPGNEIAMLHVVAAGQIIPPRQAGSLDNVLRAMLHNEPNARPTMKQCEAALRAVSEGRPDGLDAPTLPPNPVRGSTRVALNPAALSAIPASPQAPTAQPPGPPTPTGTTLPPAAAVHGQGPGMGQHPTGPPQHPTGPSHGRHPTGPPHGRHPTGPSTPVPAAQHGGEGNGGWSRARVATTVLAVLAAAAVGVLIAELLISGSGDSGDSDGAHSADGGPTTSVSVSQSTAPPSSSSAPSTEPTTQEPQPDVLPPAELEKAVADYYALMPDGVEQGWQMLGPGLQAQGEDTYLQFWDTIEAVRIVGGPTAVSGHVVEVEVEFTKADSVVRESHRLGMVVRDGKALIDSDELLNLTDLGEPDEDEDEEDEDEPDEDE
ncbi:serine/threonine-protein kinase [Saccharomonospora azurea]|uniref:non-specific serine/threonine protein kinase n=1 Tax=Saccharomonospora azurea NA-128 TaxID=882081 RepID=H8G5C5_9PSEU|nr:serine/threonine-protein kinase [Saccharomonospora azurea]EHY87179.1 serine/threonine protein kinase [Saccharomonospora azurea NA-128]